MFFHLSTAVCLVPDQNMEPVAVVVMDGLELPISTCLIQHSLVHQLGSPLLLQEGPMLDLQILVEGHTIYLCSLLKEFNTLRSVEESLDIRLETQTESILVQV